MKAILPLTLFLLTALSTDAQEQTAPAPVRKAERKNEIGALFQTDFGGNGNNNNTVLAGLQYKRWLTPHLGFRIIAAYGEYNFRSGVTNLAINQDTLITKQEHLYIHLPVVGGALEAQRHFYKRVTLFAALELKGGYGTGNTDTMVRTFYSQNNPSGEELVEMKNGHKDVNMLMLNLTAAVGAKLQFNGFSFGLELMPVQIGYQHLKFNGRSSGVSDLNMGNFSQRIFFNYRF